MRRVVCADEAGAVVLVSSDADDRRRGADRLGRLGHDALDAAAVSTARTPFTPIPMRQWSSPRPAWITTASSPRSDAAVDVVATIADLSETPVLTPEP